MKIAVILNVHNDTSLTLDTIDSIKTWVSNDILVVIDGVSWQNWGKNLEVPAFKLEGFKHGCPKSPYRNVTLGLKTAFKQWPKADWYCYCEGDVLFGSDCFKQDLQDAWVIGNDLRDGSRKFEFVEKLIGKNIERSKYLLGCCVFYHRNFLAHLTELDFFDKFLTLTNDFQEGFFPNYHGYDLAEHLYPTIAVACGGKAKRFAYWNDITNSWHGNFKKYPMRWQPQLEPDLGLFSAASILHPLKDYNHPLRAFYREKRQRNDRRL